MSDFNSLTSIVPSSHWQSIQGLLAKWFHIQPSEIDAMTIDDLLGWVDEANRQIDAQNKSG
ncbi:GpE family phage tail protein [Psychrobacter lutiphocae]|uniref:GpE family phage tail protein n=1 Tax=Psychrobacter lutiphocae TaxID=540500 RepID=UPI000399FB4A|nr:GpE family phage tail protein [Psychrobacter lutiphocae]